MNLHFLKPLRIYRRAIINFELAKYYYTQEVQLNYIFTYLNETELLFINKQLLDPFSVYSYDGYIQMLIWQLENIEFDKEEELQKRIQTEELFELGTNGVTEQIEKLHNLKSVYAKYIKGKSNNNNDYKAYL